MTAAIATQPKRSRALQVALGYNELKWPVFPCRDAPEDIVDHQTGEVETRDVKTPLVSNGLNGATLHTPLVERMWNRFPTAAIGVPTGERIGAWVLDLDRHDDRDGHKWLAAMEEKHGPLPVTARASTANGGTHIFFKHVEGIRNRAAIAPGVDTRGDGGYILAPGSEMADGRRYQWLDHAGDGMPDFAEAPAWLVDMVITKAPAPVERVKSEYTYRPEGDDFAASYTTKSFRMELDKLISAPKGQRGQQLFASACNLGEFVAGGYLSRSEAEAGLYDAAVSNGLVATDGERKCWDKIKRGLDKTANSPRQIPEASSRGDDTPALDPVVVERFVANSLRKKAMRNESAAANDNRPATPEAAPPLFSIFDWPASRFAGAPPTVVELIEGVVPQGVPIMLAAMGDTGKSYAALELHRRVSFGSSALDKPILGGRVLARGSTVFVTTEDDSNEVHRRLASLDADGKRLGSGGSKMLVVPLPSAGGPQIFWRDDKKHGLVETDAWRRLCDQLSTIEDLRMVTLDPLASFAHVQLNEDPAAGAFVCASLGRLASETRATVAVLHHMRKAQKAIESLADAREAIRGSTALVDGLRLAYALWPAEESRARRVCKDLTVAYAPNRVVLGGVVKANGAAKRIVSTYVRNDFGLLIDRTADLGAAAPPQEDLSVALVLAIETAAKAGQPFTKTGSTGLFAMRERLPVELRGLARHRLEAMATKLVEERAIMLCLASGTTAKWLDVPGGPFAIGLGNFRKGGAI